jgi:hypothetical protein
MLCFTPYQAHNGLVKMITKKCFIIITYNCNMKESCTQINLSCYISPMYLYASWHAFHHIKACIIYIRAVYTRVRRFVLNKCWGGWCWSIFEKVSSTNGVGKGHPSMVLVSSICEVGARSDFCDLSMELTFSATQASPGYITTLLFYKCFITP